MGTSAVPSVRSTNNTTWQLPGLMVSESWRMSDEMVGNGQRYGGEE